MLYRYNIELPLEYNNTYHYGCDYSASYFIKTEPAFQWKIPGRFGTAAITVENCSNESKACFWCKIDGWIAKNREEALRDAAKEVGWICKHLTLEINKENGDRHKFQPRVEACWDRVVWHEDSCNYPDERDTQSPGEIRLHDDIHVREVISFGITWQMDTAKMDYQGWIEEPDESLGFMIEEYYLALGQESVTSKFFHLFSIIEFIEQKYKDYAGAQLLFSEEENEMILKAVKASVEANGIKNRANNLASRVGSSIGKATDLNRIKKLKNILAWLGIEELGVSRKKTPITEEFLKGITTLRNKSFHGQRDPEKEYEERVLDLFDLCEKIIEGAKKRAKESHSPENG